MRKGLSLEEEAFPVATWVLRRCVWSRDEDPSSSSVWAETTWFDKARSNKEVIAAIAIFMILLNGLHYFCRSERLVDKWCSKTMCKEMLFDECLFHREDLGFSFFLCSLFCVSLTPRLC